MKNRPDNEQSAGGRSATWRWLATVTVLVVGCALTAATWHSLRTTQNELLQARFEKDADVFVGLLQRQLDQVREIGRAIKAFYAGALLVSRHEFEEFAWTYVLEVPDVEAVQWVFPVRSEERRAHENRGGRALSRPYEIVERRDGQWDSAGARDRHLPAYYSVSNDPRKWPVGLDWAVYPHVVQTIQKARETGRISFVGPVSNSSEQAGEARAAKSEGEYFLAIVQIVPSAATYSGLESTQVFVSSDPEEAERQSDTSFAVLAFQVLSWQEVRERISVPGGIDMYVVEEVPAGELRLMHSIKSEMSLGKWRREEVESRGELFQRERIELNDVRWAVHVVSTPAYRDMRQIQPALVVLLGLLATGALAALVFVGTRRIEHNASC